MNWKNWFQKREEPLIWEDGSLQNDVNKSVLMGHTLGGEDGSIAYDELKGPGRVVTESPRDNGPGIFESDLKQHPGTAKEWLDIDNVSALDTPKDILIRVAAGDLHIQQEVAKRILALEARERRRELNEYPAVMVDPASDKWSLHPVEHLRDQVVIADKEFGEPVGTRDPSAPIDQDSLLGDMIQ